MVQWKQQGRFWPSDTCYGYGSSARARQPCRCQSLPIGSVWLGFGVGCSWSVWVWVGGVCWSDCSTWNKLGGDLEKKYSRGLVVSPLGLEKKYFGVVLGVRSDNSFPKVFTMKILVGLYLVSGNQSSILKTPIASTTRHPFVLVYVPHWLVNVLVQYNPANNLIVLWASCGDVCLMPSLHEYTS